MSIVNAFENNDEKEMLEYIFNHDITEGELVNLVRLSIHTNQKKIYEIFCDNFDLNPILENMDVSNDLHYFSYPISKGYLKENTIIGMISPTSEELKYLMDNYPMSDNMKCKVFESILEEGNMSLFEQFLENYDIMYDREIMNITIQGLANKLKYEMLECFLKKLCDYIFDFDICLDGIWHNLNIRRIPKIIKIINLLNKHGFNLRSNEGKKIKELKDMMNNFIDAIEHITC